MPGKHAEYAEHDPIARLIREAGPRRDPSPERAERVRKAVHASFVARARREKSRPPRWILAAAAVVLGVGLATFFSSRSLGPTPVAGVVDVAAGSVLLDGKPVSRGTVVEADATIVTTVGARVSLRLSSGASLRLDERTHLTFVEPGRVRLARGAVYVDSAADVGAPSGPTVVETPLGEARDVGTRFEVRVDEETLLVRVRDGAVIVHGKRERLDAAAGEEVEIRRSGRVARREVLPYDRTWDWTAQVAPPFELRGASFGGFLAWAGRELGVDVRFADDGLAESAPSVRLEGSIEGLTPREALDVVIPSTGLDYRIEDGTLLVRETGNGR